MAGTRVSIELSAVNNAMAPIRDLVSQLNTLGTKGEAAGAKGATGMGFLGKAMGGVSSVIKGTIASLSSLGTAIAAVAAVWAGGKLVGEFNEAANQLDKVNDAARRTGLSVGFLSELKFAAEQNGVAFEGVTASVSTFQKNISQFARTGGGRAAEVIQTLGVTLTQTDGSMRSVNDLLPEFIDRLAGVADESTRVELATRLFGSSEVLQFFKEGGAGLKEMADEAARLNVVFSPEQAAKADAYNDSIGRIKAAYLGLRVALVDKLAPVLTDLFDQAAGFIAALPTIIATAYNLVRQAIAGTLSEEQVARMAAVGEKLKSALMAVVQVAISAGVNVTMAAIRALPGLLGPAMEFMFDALIMRPLVSVLQRAGEAVAEKARGFAYVLGGAMKFAGFESAGSALQEGLLGVANAADGAAMALGGVNTASESLDGGKAAEIAAQLKTAMADVAVPINETRQAWDEVTGAVRGAVSEMDKVLNISVAISKHQVGAGVTGPKPPTTPTPTILNTPAAVKAITIDRRETEETEENLERIKQKAEEIPFTLKNIYDGIGRGIKGISDDIASTVEWAAAATRSLAMSMSQGMTDAIFDVIDGTKSLTEAFTNFASQTFRMIAQLILQMLVLKAIAGIASAFAAPAVPGAAEGVSVAPPTTAIPGFEVNGFLPSGFASGGLVAGPNVDYDVVPAMLTPGEFVMTRAATQAIGADRLASANRSGSIDGGGGGVHITVQTGPISMSGGASSQDISRLEQVIVGAVRKAMDQQPGFREFMKRRLA